MMSELRCTPAVALGCRIACSTADAAEPLLAKTRLLEERTHGFTLYRVPGIIVTAQGTVLAYCEARKFSDADRGEIVVHLRRSTDHGATWLPATKVAHLGPRLARNPHMSDAKLKKELPGPGLLAHTVLSKY